MIRWNIICSGKKTNSKKPPNPPSTKTALLNCLNSWRQISVVMTIRFTMIRLYLGSRFSWPSMMQPKVSNLDFMLEPRLFRIWAWPPTSLDSCEYLTNSTPRTTVSSGASPTYYCLAAPLSCIHNRNGAHLKMWRSSKSWIISQY